MLSPIRSETSEEKDEKHDAMRFLRETLKQCEKAAKEVQAEAKQIGISEATLRRAKTALGIKSEKRGGNYGGDPQWFWKMLDTEDVHKGILEPLQVIEANKAIYTNDLAEGVQYNTFEYLQPENEHLQPSKCSNCNIEMKLTEARKTWFCPIGCGG
jgi:hypothetical protein